MDFKDAIASALNIVQHFYGEQAKDYRLEEISLPETAPSGHWEITVGFLMPDRNPRTGGAVFMALGDKDAKQLERVYKKIFLDRETGEFKKMENRLTV